jgi:ATP-dependent DNA helicase RecG
MAPTEILAQQHYAGLKGFCGSGITYLDILTGSTRQRREMLADLKEGKIAHCRKTHAGDSPASEIRYFV